MFSTRATSRARARRAYDGTANYDDTINAPLGHFPHEVVCRLVAKCVLCKISQNHIFVINTAQPLFPAALRRRDAGHFGAERKTEQGGLLDEAE